MKSVQGPDALVIEGGSGEFLIRHDLCPAPGPSNRSQTEGQPPEIVAGGSRHAPDQISLVDAGGDAKRLPGRIRVGMDDRVVPTQQIRDGLQRRPPHIRLRGGRIELVYRPQNMGLAGDVSLSNKRSPFIIARITSSSRERHT